MGNPSAEVEAYLSKLPPERRAVLEEEIRSLAEVSMPKLKSDMHRGQLVKWAKETGDSVQIGDVVAFVKPDEGMLEVTSEVKGKLLDQLVNVGDWVSIGAPIAVVGQSGNQPSDAIPLRLWLIVGIIVVLSLLFLSLNRELPQWNHLIYVLIVSLIAGFLWHVPQKWAMDWLWKKFFEKLGTKGDDEHEGARFFSAWIGIVERIAYVCGWLLGAPQVVAIILGLKASSRIATWEKGSAGRALFNLWLIGNLLSVIGAILIAEIAKVSACLRGSPFMDYCQFWNLAQG